MSVRPVVAAPTSLGQVGAIPVAVAVAAPEVSSSRPSGSSEGEPGGAMPSVEMAASVEADEAAPDVSLVAVPEQAATTRATASAPNLTPIATNLACIATSWHSSVPRWIRLTTNRSTGRERLEGC